ncbi:hypothetical protein U9M48_014984 [Paspalum notatum var. saurae]|uniref:Uncharacterized protein n=1 Tax=Paspalum notatum var. saurae TaxID=547442 RepID=A0AAQ3T5I1_PASNO
MVKIVHLCVDAVVPALSTSSTPVEHTARRPRSNPLAPPSSLPSSTVHSASLSGQLWRRPSLHPRRSGHCLRPHLESRVCPVGGAGGSRCSPPGGVHSMRSGGGGLFSVLVLCFLVESIIAHLVGTSGLEVTTFCSVSRSADKAPEESLKKTIEVDRLIDLLRDANPRELDQIVVENVLAFDAGFWKDYEELAENVMNIVDRLVHKTDQKIEQSTDVLKAIISPAMHEGDVKWPPREPDTLKLMEKEISRLDQEGQLDEGFLSEVSAQLRQAKQDGDKPGLQAMLQKVLQLYASKSLQKRSYAYKGGQVVVPEKFLESVIQAPENEWNKVLLDGLTVGKGDVSPDDLYAVINKRIERVLIRTEGGSYQQRILVEYLKEIQARAEEIGLMLGPDHTRGAQEMERRDTAR